MMTLAAAEQEGKKGQEGSAAAHSVLERVAFPRGFAASALRH